MKIKLILIGCLMFVTLMSLPMISKAEDLETNGLVEDGQQLEVEMVSSKDQVIKGDVVRYTISITTIGSVELANLRIQDEIPLQLEYLSDSLSRNGVRINDQLGYEDNYIKINVVLLDVGDSVDVAFEAKVLDASVPVINNLVEVKTEKGDIYSDSQTLLVPDASGPVAGKGLLLIFLALVFGGLMGGIYYLYKKGLIKGDTF